MGRSREPGPGSPATVSTVELPDDGSQNVAASVTIPVAGKGASGDVAAGGKLERGAGGLTSREVEAVRARLRALGYIE